MTEERGKFNLGFTSAQTLDTNKIYRYWESFHNPLQNNDNFFEFHGSDVEVHSPGTAIVTEWRVPTGKVNSDLNLHEPQNPTDYPPGEGAKIQTSTVGTLGTELIVDVKLIALQMVAN